MKEDQEHKCHMCRFCKQNFSDGKQLGGHMRRHLALISAGRKKGSQENIQEAINGEKGFDVHIDDDRLIKNSQGINQDYDTDCRKQSIQANDQEIINGKKGLDADDLTIKNAQPEQDCGANVYVLRENPKKSWRVSSSSKGCGNLTSTHRRCQSRKETVKNTVCEQCGKVFDSAKALYGHMRCHSIKRSQPSNESSSLSSSEEHDNGVANALRKKRSCTRYKSPKPNHLCTGMNSVDDEVENGALCLMMLSRGVTSLDGIQLIKSNQAKFAASDG